MKPGFAFALGAVLALLPGLAAGPAAACGAGSDCLVAGGRYRIHLPAGPGRSEKRLAAIVFFHGWQSMPAEAMADPDLMALADRLGVAVIAPEGQGRTWSYPGSPGQHRDEFAFVDAVLRDAVPRFGLDSGRLLATGFSQGASMVWWLACRMPERFALFAPVAGAFWEPLPASCTGPVPTLLHLHGLADTTVPMAGRRIRDRFRQADVRQSFAVLGGQCPPLRPELKTASELLACERAGPCAGSRELELCLHPGGHVFSADWVARAWARGVRLGLL